MRWIVPAGAAVLNLLVSAIWVGSNQGWLWGLVLAVYGALISFPLVVLAIRVRARATLPFLAGLFMVWLPAIIWVLGVQAAELFY